MTYADLLRHLNLTELPVSFHPIIPCSACIPTFQGRHLCTRSCSHAGSLQGAQP
jgi:hypothetical protein